MSNTGLLRKGIALAAIIPFTVFGLTACAGGSGSDETAERTREPKATSQESQGDAGSSGGSLPFPFPDGSDQGSSDSGASGVESSDAGSAGGSSGSGANGSGSSGSNGSGSSGNNSSGNGVVKYDDIDLSNVNWTTLCSSDTDSQYVIASDDDATGDETGPTLMVSADENGKPDYLFISEGSSDGATSLYWSSTADAGSVTMNFNGDKFSASGEAFYFSDYSYKNPISFEIQLTCDVTY